VNLEATMVAAAEEGRDAVRGKKPRSDNPYSLESDDPRERTKALMWLRGWSDANPMELGASAA
jgi:hypothetical protein